jgi:alpha-galactosidase
MPRLVFAGMNRLDYQRIAGHCHGSIHLRDKLAKIVDVPEERIDLEVAGINHFHIVQRATDRETGADLLTALNDITGDRLEQWKQDDFTQWKMFSELGSLIGHGIWHNFDYLPYANGRMFANQDENTWPRQCLKTTERRKFEGEAAQPLLADDQTQSFMKIPEKEQIYPIMSALSGLRGPYRYLSGNLPNRGSIPGLPDEAIVELPANVEKNKICLIPPSVPLPGYFTRWIETQIEIHRLSVEAVLQRRRQFAIEAIALDPVFRDCDCSPAKLLDELLEANKGLVPELE